MDESYLVDGRQHFEDDDAIDRAMLDCFSETDQLDTMDYISAPSFSMMNNLFNQSHQRGSYPYGKDVAPPRKNNTSNCGMNNSSQLMPQINYNNGQYNSISNLTDCGLTSSSSESSLNQANMMKNQNQSPSIFSKLGNSMSPSNSNKRKLSATGIKSENAAIEAPPTKSELKSQLVIVSRERRRERNKFLARKTRVKKKAEVESLWAQVSQLRTENERLKEAVRVSAPKTTESILMNCNFTLPKKVSDLVDKMLAAGCLSGINKSDLRSFCIINATAPDGPIVYASRHFVELTGYEMHSILGHNCRFLQGPDTDRNELNKLKKAIEEGREETVIIKNYRRDGTPFWNRTHISPMRDERGVVTLIIGLQTEMYLSYENGKVFTTVEPVSLATNSCNGSTTGRSDSNGSSHNCNESRAGSSEDGTTDGTNDESESHNGSTTFSEIDENHTR